MQCGLSHQELQHRLAVNTFLLLTIAASVVLLIVEGAFLARLPAEKIHAILRRSILIASALVVLALVVLGTWHLAFALLAVMLPFIDRIYAKLRERLREFDPAAAWRYTTQQIELYRRRARTVPPLSARGKAKPSREQNNAAARHVDMTREQALNILGLSRGAGPVEIKDAHRRLMRIMHPDRGGTSEQAAQVNRAKDVLISNN